MALREILHTLLSNDRTSVRKEMVTLFLDEVAGTGNGDKTSKYNYIVESYLQYKIIIKRPGLLNKGFDFGIDIEGIKFKNKHNNGFHIPSHSDIFDILNQVKIKYPNDYSKVKSALLKLFNLEDIDSTKFEHMYFADYLNNQHPVYIVLLAIKWLFIEQDITYWNWSGRNMLKESLEKDGLM